MSCAVAIAAAQVSAEEIETLNEELQATNEELRDAHEEAQATVEELNVATSELQLRASELEERRRASEVEHARLAAILANMADAVLVVDRQGEVVLHQCRLRPALRRDGRLHPRRTRRVSRIRHRNGHNTVAAQGEAFQPGLHIAGPGWNTSLVRVQRPACARS